MKQIFRILRHQALFFYQLLMNDILVVSTKNLNVFITNKYENGIQKVPKISNQRTNVFFKFKNSTSVEVSPYVLLNQLEYSYMYIDRRLWSGKHIRINCYKIRFL